MNNEFKVKYNFVFALGELVQVAMLNRFVISRNTKIACIDRALAQAG